MAYKRASLILRKITGGWNVTPPSTTTTDVLYIYPNLTDTKPRLILLGASTFSIDVPSGSYVGFMENGANRFKIDYTSPDVLLEVLQDNTNLFLKPMGTGKVKFGVYDATPADASAGFIPILDAAGNARKLMCQA